MVVERLIGVIGLVLVIASIFLPWLTIELFGRFEFSLYDLLRISFQNNSISVGESSVSGVTAYSLTLSIISLFAAIIAGLVSVITYKASPVAGSLSIISGIA